MGADHYYTLSSAGEGLYKEKGSKFLAFAWHVGNPEEIEEYLNVLRKKYYDARYHCYAWVLGEGYDQYRANDDGEPMHSAGDPILSQVRSANLTDVLVVVVRYFGGTKLGVSGLINAYKTAAAEALKEAISVKVNITRNVSINYDYDATNSILRLVDDYDLHIIHQDYSERCTLNAGVKINLLDVLKKQLKLLVDTGSNIKYSFEENKK